LPPVAASSRSSAALLDLALAALDLDQQLAHRRQQRQGVFERE